MTIIDTDIEMIQSAASFGFKIYYGDGTRLDVLHASGADSARAIAICIDQRAATDRIAELCKHEFPQAKLLARSFDREHALKLVIAGVDVQIRETFESALLFGAAALREIGVPQEEAEEIAAEVRQRDAERFQLELSSRDVRAGVGLMFNNTQGAKPIPFTPPQRESRALNDEAVAAAAREGGVAEGS